MRIHVLANLRRADATAAAGWLMGWLREHGVSAAAESELAARIGAEPVALEDLAQADLVVTLGGDGTLIRGAHLCSPIGTPILGVHFGRFGFVTQCTGDDLGAALSHFFDGSVIIDERMMVEAIVLRGGEPAASMHCLNEAALHREATARLMSFEVRIDDVLLAHYPADGFLVASPTGSTAYSLSAGGPILDPRLQALVVTAITPHTLSARPFVVDPGAVIDIATEADGGVVLSGDGQNRIHLLADDIVRVVRSDRVTRLVLLEEKDFLVKLRERLLWSRSALGSVR